MSAYHSVQGERGGERESTKSKRTEGQKGEKERGGEGRAEGGSFPLGGAMERSKERIKKRKRNACVPFGLAVRRLSQILPTQEDIQMLLEK